MNYYAIPGMKFKGKFEDTVGVEYSYQKRDLILKAVLRFYDISMEDIFGKSRKRPICTARQVAMYLMHKILNHGCVQIGNFFKMDHTSAIHSFSLVQDLMDTNEQFRNEVREIEENIF